MYTFLLVLYLITCFAMVVVILLQSSKGGGLAGAFGGGGGMGAVFGGRGAATFLSRVTTVLAVAFMSLSLLLSFMNKGSTSGSLVEKERQKTTTVAPGAGLPVVPTEDALPLPVEEQPAQAEPATAGSDTAQ